MNDEKSYNFAVTSCYNENCKQIQIYYLLKCLESKFQIDPPLVTGNYDVVDLFHDKKYELDAYELKSFDLELELTEIPATRNYDCRALFIDDDKQLLITALVHK